MNWRIVQKLHEFAVIKDEGLARLVSHADEFIGWFVFVFNTCLFRSWQSEEVFPCCVVCSYKLHIACVVIDEPSHRHEGHQCAQQQCYANSVKDRCFLGILYSQHVIHLYGLYAKHPTPCSPYRSWGAKCLISTVENAVPQGVLKEFITSEWCKRFVKVTLLNLAKNVPGKL